MYGLDLCWGSIRDPNIVVKSPHSCVSSWCSGGSWNFKYLDFSESSETADYLLAWLVATEVSISFSGHSAGFFSSSCTLNVSAFPRTGQVTDYIVFLSNYILLSHSFSHHELLMIQTLYHPTGNASILALLSNVVITTLSDQCTTANCLNMRTLNKGE